MQSILSLSTRINSMLWGIVEPLLQRRQATRLAEIRAWLRGYKGGGVALERDDDTGIATIRLDQPEKRNAISGHMMTALEEAIQELESWPQGKGVLLYGTGHHFCAGGDLDFASRIANPTDGLRMASYMQTVLARLRRLPLVSVALVEGAGALGGGAEVAMSCDWRLVARGSAGIGHVHRHMGLAPAWGGAATLVQVVGYAKALDLLTTGRMVPGPEAVELGLAQQVLDSDDPVSEAIAWLKHRTQGPPQVIRSIKLQASNAREAAGLTEEVLTREKHLFAPLWGGTANLQALTAKIKRKL